MDQENDFGARRICLVLADLKLGGAERVITSLANHWAAKGARVTIVTFGAAGDTTPYFQLAETVRLKPLGMPALGRRRLGSYTQQIQRIARLRRTFREENPDVVISFLRRVNILTLVATRGMGVATIVSDRNNPKNDPGARLWNRLARWLYPLASLVVFQTRAIQETMPFIADGRRRVIPNPIVPTPRTPADRREKVLVAAGRLTWEKSFDDLLRAFARLGDRHRDWSLVIYGDGPERDRLVALRKELGLEDQVSLPGATTTPHGWIHEADAFVLSSQSEGFPNALGEAMAAGLPVVACDCAYGPSDMIEPSVSGLLVPPKDPEKLAEGLRLLFEDEALRDRLGREAARAMERFRPEAVMSLWDRAIECRPR